MSFLWRYFWVIDFSLGALVPLTVLVLYRRKTISPFTWRLFWAGVLIGLLWEVPLSALDGFGVVDFFRFITPPPLHFSVIIISHSFWDGGLFLAGAALVRMLCREPHFAAFRWQELVILIIWGQAQELAVELTSTGTAGWVYIPAWWNPSLFLFNGRDITMLPQLIWLAAPILFYAVALQLTRELASNANAHPQN